jgi:hypothetical protein
MNICIGGGSGFIGQYLVKFLQERGHRVMVIHRSEWELERLKRYLNSTEVLLNFVGEPIQGIWTKEKKRRILNSRVQTTNLLAKMVKTGKFPVKVWINASAVGIYDAQHVHDENSHYLADNFLACVVRKWEEPVLNLDSKFIRCIVLRLGVVLGKDGGMMQKLQLANKFKTGFDIRISMPLPFIHIHDLARAILFSIEHSDIRDVLNAVSPERITTKRLFDAFNAQHKPWIILPVSEVWMARIMGESAVLFTGGQQVVPNKLLQAGFTFDFQDISNVIEDIWNLKHTF